jgi:hypothetical protein
MATNQATKKSDYITRVQQAVDAFLTCITSLETLTLEGQSLGYVASGSQQGSLQDGDFIGANQFLSAAVFASVMATVIALDQEMHANNAAILASLFQMRS